MTIKNPNTKTIEISTETYDRLHSIKEELAEIFQRKISFDMLLKLLVNPKIIDYSEFIAHEKPKTQEKTEIEPV